MLILKSHPSVGESKKWMCLLQIVVTYLYYPTRVGFTYRVRHSIWPLPTRGASGVVVLEHTPCRMVLSTGVQSLWSSDLMRAWQACRSDLFSCRPQVRMPQYWIVPAKRTWGPPLSSSHLISHLKLCSLRYGMFGPTRLVPTRICTTYVCSDLLGMCLLVLACSSLLSMGLNSSNLIQYS